MGLLIQVPQEIQGKSVCIILDSWSYDLVLLSFSETWDDKSPLLNKEQCEMASATKQHILPQTHHVREIP